ncbi:hypothetical protein [Cohnella caldifontis]|uniref:hypothetical protein n=1 Tax=Cohnella caldifontis TaxID=3027471 RepID=UPI0023EDD6AA|nr:hypothetical protein [Cohnella sp. YIM B05605]
MGTPIYIIAKAEASLGGWLLLSAMGLISERANVRRSRLGLTDAASSRATWR